MYLGMELPGHVMTGRRNKGDFRGAGAVTWVLVMSFGC